MKVLWRICRSQIVNCSCVSGVWTQTSRRSVAHAHYTSLSYCWTNKEAVVFVQWSVVVTWVLYQWHVGNIMVVMLLIVIPFYRNEHDPVITVNITNWLNCHISNYDMLLSVKGSIITFGWINCTAQTVFIGSFNGCLSKVAVCNVSHWWRLR